MSRAEVQEILLPGDGPKRGEVVVPTRVGDPAHGVLRCQAAPLVAGSLRAKGRPVRLTDLARADPAGDVGARLFLATCPHEGGGTTAIAAATAPGDALSASAARSAVEEWAAVCGNRSLLLAAGPWCSGALHAASAARQAAAKYQGARRVHVLAPAAMPAETAGALSELGAILATSLDGVEPGDVVVFPAHGATAEVRAEAMRRGITVVDATCPIVASAQEAAGRAAERGDEVALIGQPDHASTKPITSQAPGRVTVVDTPARTATLPAGDGGHVSYLLQPGFAVEAAAPIASALRSRYPSAGAAVPAEVCYAPSDRSGAIHTVALGSDLMLVVGEPRSADTRQVCTQARDCGTRVQVVAEVADLRPAMLAPVQTIGLAESTSARAGLAAQVLDALSGLGRLAVARRRVSTESAAGVLR